MLEKITLKSRQSVVFNSCIVEGVYELLITDNSIVTPLENYSFLLELHF